MARGFYGRRVYMGSLTLPEWVLGRLLYYAYADQEVAWEDVEREFHVPPHETNPGHRARSFAKEWADDMGMAWPPCFMETPRRDPVMTLAHKRPRRSA